MGRRKKYHTDEERVHAKRERWKRWYDKNKDEHNDHRMKEYYEKRINEMEEKLSKL
jgi:hypothetical protein